ncbi:MAG: Ribonuclease HII [Syntrophomonadaceae bacterium]|nr:Ribonuclease HII [Bacillota bacterium]
MKDLAEERKRLRRMSTNEERLRTEGATFIAGIDEVGRGALAGPVVAAAVVLPEEPFIDGVRDSKKLSPIRREEIFAVIYGIAISIGVGVIDAKVIDKINILQATYLAMRQAVSRLSFTPDYLLIDGFPVPEVEVPQLSLLKGDSRSISIAAASIIAKVTRDRIMIEEGSAHPYYGFLRHKGYGTKEHYRAIAKYGPCSIHRQSFNLFLHDG